MKRRHPDEDPEIEDWDPGANGWRDRWALDQILRERPQSIARQQRNEEGWD